MNQDFGFGAFSTINADSTPPAIRAINYRFGFIGVGNMGGAILTAICRALPEETVYICDKDTAKTAEFQKKYSCIPADSRTLAQKAEYIFLGVKPQFMDSMLSEIRDILSARMAEGKAPVCITMAAGMTIEKIREMIGADVPMIRIMPNMPVAVGQGMILYDASENVTEEQIEKPKKTIKQKNKK